MAKRITSVLGIDVGSQRIKVCEMKTQGRDPVVTALGVIDTPEGAVDHTGVYNAEAVGAAIKQALNDCGASTPHAVISIAGQASVLVRTLEVPKMNPSELKDHMQWEITRNIPFAESTIVSDFKPLGGDDPNSQNMDVVMAIAPQSAIDTIITCVKKAGRTAAAIDVEPLSLARSVQASYEDVVAGKTVCLVEVGANTMSINIYQGSKLLMPRQVPLGGQMFTKAISDTLGIGLAEAETLKRERLEVPESAATAASQPYAAPSATQQFQPYNPFSDDPGAVPSPFGDTTAYADPQFAAPDPYAVQDQTPTIVGDPEVVRLYNAIAPVLDEFVAEIRRSIDYFRSKGGDVNVVYLTGGGVKIRGLAPFLQAVLGVECDAYDPLRRLNLNVRKVAPTFIDEHGAEFAVSLGNALHIFFD